MRNRAQTSYFHDQHQKVWEKNINLSQDRRMQSKSRDGTTISNNLQPKGTPLILSQSKIRPPQLTQSASFVETQELLTKVIGDTAHQKKRLFEESMLSLGRPVTSPVSPQLKTNTFNNFFETDSAIEIDYDGIASKRGVNSTQVKKHRREDLQKQL